MCMYMARVLISIIRKWGKEMEDAMVSLKADLIKEVDVYIKDTLQKWVIYEVIIIFV